MTTEEHDPHEVRVAKHAISAAHAVAQEEADFATIVTGHPYDVIQPPEDPDAYWVKRRTSTKPAIHHDSSVPTDTELH